MGTASLGGRVFRIDPTSVRWGYRIKFADKKTVGGKVVQVLGANFSDMVVTGSFGRGGLAEQNEFLKAMKAIGDAQVRDAGVRNSTTEPMHFRFPDKGWDYLVYLKAYTNPRGPMSIRVAPEEFSPMWRLTLFIVEDNTGMLRKRASDAFISRLSAGLGWKQTKYNGPMEMAEVEQLLNGQGIRGYLQSQFDYGVGGTVPSGNQEVSPQ